jgi:hypothetical protein
LIFKNADSPPCNRAFSEKEITGIHLFGFSLMIYPISVTGYHNKINKEYYVIRKPEMIHAAMLERNKK